MGLSWCKMASNLDSHPKIRKSGRNGREVFLFALRRNAEPDNLIPGVLPADKLEPWYLADQLMMTESDACDGLERCVTAKLLVREGLSYRIVGWDTEWGKGPVAGKDRTAKWRDNQKLGESVTTPTSPNVTQRHGDARDALDQKRSDLSPETKARKKAKTDVPPDWTPSGALTVSDREQLARFIDHHRSKGNQFVEIERAWSNWKRRAPEFAPTGQTSSKVLRMFDDDEVSA